MEDLPLFASNLKNSRSSLTVSQLTMKVKGMLEMELGEVWVRGEVSNFKPASSGHFYFNLKDDASMISAVCFKNTWLKIRSILKVSFDLKDGV